MTRLDLTDAEHRLLLDLLTREPSGLALGILARMTTAAHLRGLADRLEIERTDA